MSRYWKRVATTAVGFLFYTCITAAPASSVPTPPSCPPNGDGAVTDRDISFSGGECTPPPPPPPPPGGDEDGPKATPASKKPPIEYEIEHRPCDHTRAECRLGAVSCDGEPLLSTFSREKGSGDPWHYEITTCGPPDPEELDLGDPARPPPTPTRGQIQAAFRELPFSQPRVSIQPVGWKTLINLPTYYEATWPSSTGLKPGEVSKKIKLLSWTVEFKVAVQDYRYVYGDGATSGWVRNSGGIYPDGEITHKYTKTGKYTVKVDARLTGQYRVNGGAWQDIATTADLQEEPTNTLQALGTKTRLVDGPEN